jgi:class 3 adenylate cyclase
VNKFIGDAVMAIFGAPLEDPQHPQNALSGGLGDGQNSTVSGVS